MLNFPRLHRKNNDYQSINPDQFIVYAPVPATSSQGFVGVKPVPEPATMLLLGFGRIDRVKEKVPEIKKHIISLFPKGRVRNGPAFYIHIDETF